MPNEIMPIKSDEMVERQVELIPDIVIETFNELITQNGSSGRATVLQKDVVERLEEAGINRADIFDQHMLDVEDIYRQAGWEVTYDKPVAWGGESFEAYFEFRASMR